MNTPVEATPRKAMTPSRRAKVLARSDGHCAYPECEVTANLEIDHIVPLELAGADNTDNLQALCEGHHAQKTRLDIKMIAKARRIRKTLAGLRKTKRPLKSRGFDKSRRKKMDGSVEVKG